jgi:hypothetical protein
MKPYRWPLRHMLPWLLDIVLGRKRSFSADSWLVVFRYNEPPLIEGTEHIPRSGPVIIVGNHLDRPEVMMAFAGMAASVAVAQARPERPEVHWTITAERRQMVGPVRIPRAIVRWLFERIARMYDFALMEPGAPFVMQRAAAMRELEEAIARGDAVGLMPEAGGDGVLRRPRPGSGLFLARLSAGRVPILPLALFIEGDRLVVRFGPVFTLEASGEPADERDRDRRLSERVMTAIGRLLPPEWRGVYREAVERPEDTDENVTSG